ncbi:MAG: pectin acetylesterase-family hydrolase [Myxococcota bacterium]
MNARWMTLPLALGALGCTGDPELTEPVADCGAEALQTCVAEYGAAIASCYTDAGGPCAADDAGTTAALDTLSASLDACTVGALDEAATDARLRNACASESESLAWRTYGGPQGAAWAEADDGQRSCLSGAHAAATAFVADSLTAITDCDASGDCEATSLDNDRSPLRDTARDAVNAACGLLPNLIALDVPTYLERADQQIDCLAATVHDDDGLGLQCGPTFAQFEAPRGEWTQVVVDSEIWGTQCADGTDYAFQIRWAPEGEPLDRVLIGLQGGGVCLFEEDCAERLISNPGLFNALDDEPIESGIVSNDPNESAFANWTKVYLPYCNQDVFTGGGVDEVLGGTTVPRFGAVNLRAAMQMVRDALWAELDAEGGAGFRPDEVVALFGGFSAGGYGTLYNYHWMIDDLQWPRTAAYPDAGLALDNGSVFGVRGIGLLKVPDWGTTPYLPPYCFEGDCAVGEVIFNALSPRLETVPEQRMLVLTNPYDLIQQGDAFFGEDTAAFMNELRASYCRTKDLPGIDYYITSVSDKSTHVVSLRPELWSGEVDGETMRDWFERAIEMPETLEDRAEEADFVKLFEGVKPYPCEVAP